MNWKSASSNFLEGLVYHKYCLFLKWLKQFTSETICNAELFFCNFIECSQQIKIVYIWLIYIVK